MKSEMCNALFSDAKIKSHNPSRLDKVCIAAGASPNYICMFFALYDLQISVDHVP